MAGAAMTFTSNFNYEMGPSFAQQSEDPIRISDWCSPSRAPPLNPPIGLPLLPLVTTSTEYEMGLPFPE